MLAIRASRALRFTDRLPALPQRKPFIDGAPKFIAKFSTAKTKSEQILPGPSWSVEDFFAKMKAEKITADQLQHIATLARLSIPKEKTDALCDDMGKIVSWVKHCQEVDTKGVPPLLSVMEDTSLPLREDIADKNLPSADEILSGAPEKQSNYFVVPKIRGEEQQQE